MNWTILDTHEQLESIAQECEVGPVVIYKHSYRCSIATVAHNRIDSATELSQSSAYILDVVKHRDISLQIAETYSVQHESPQILVLYKGDVVYHTSHLGITPGELADQISALAAA